MSAAQDVRSAPDRRFRSRVVGGILAALGIGVLLLVGRYFTRKAEELATTYGKRRGFQASASVNGTSVLADMFVRAGHKVRTVARLSPLVKDRAEIIIWIPDGFTPPDQKQREFLEGWLTEGRGRTLIYVGRDFDAAGEYWKDVMPQVSGDQAAKYEHLEAESRAAHDAARWKMPGAQYARWFTARRDEKKYKVTALQGPWADGIDAAKTEIIVEGRLEPPIEKDRTTAAPPAGVTPPTAASATSKTKTSPPAKAKPTSKPTPTSKTTPTGKTTTATVTATPPADQPPLPNKVTPLLWSDMDGDGFSPKDAIVTRITDKSFGTGQVIVVANGSFVLNYPLVNHEHDKLAGKLIEECGPPATVVFLESQGDGPDVLEKDPEGERGLLEILQVWPLNAILIHLTVLGIVYCLARSPIFGRAKELPPETPADFGKHITALGQLMARSKDRAYAEQRVQQYLQQGKRASGKSHLKGP